MRLKTKQNGAESAIGQRKAVEAVVLEQALIQPSHIRVVALQSVPRQEDQAVMAHYFTLAQPDSHLLAAQIAGSLGHKYDPIPLGAEASLD